MFNVNPGLVSNALFIVGAPVTDGHRFGHRSGEDVPVAYPPVN